VHRAIFFAATITAFAAAALPAAAPGSVASRHRATSDSITLRIQYKNGAWGKALSLPLNRLHLKAFKVCGVYNFQAGSKFTCTGSGASLPERTLLRMEQSPVARAQKRPDSPGWGLVGMSSEPVMRVPLSNEVTADKWGTFYYRATLRDLSGKVILTSNKVKLVWHKP
jgi:hypothetical protein